MLLVASPGWSAGAPAAEQSPGAIAQQSRTRRNSELDYGDLGEPIDGPPGKRIGRLASWGKKSDMSWLDQAARKAVRSKWSNSNMAVWGKRVVPVDKRGKWKGNNMAVWG